MKTSANVRRAEPTPRRAQDGETYSAAMRSRSTSTQPIAVPSTATHTSCSRIARATRWAAPRAAHRSACSLDTAGTASARIALRRMLASASSSAGAARLICIRSLAIDRQSHEPSSTANSQCANKPQKRQNCPLAMEQPLFGEELTSGQCVEPVPPHVSMPTRVRGKVEDGTYRFDEENEPRTQADEQAPDE